MNRRQLLSLGLRAGPAAALGVVPLALPPDPEPTSRWITTESLEYQLNTTLITDLVKRAPLSRWQIRSARICNVTNRVLELEVFATDSSGNRRRFNAQRKELATRFVDVEHLGVRWPVNPIVGESIPAAP